MSPSLEIQDLVNVQNVRVTVEGTEPGHQIICFGKHHVRLAEFLKAAEFVLFAGDLGDETDPRRKFQKNVSELQLGEGSWVGARRFRPSHERLMTGTVTPHG